MCGIVGRVNWTGAPIDRTQLELQNQSLIHRGPDDSGLWIGEGAGLAMRRLVVVDRKGGHQPMNNGHCPLRANNPPIQLVYNGEIYNTPFLRADLEMRGHRFVSRCDTEIVLHAFEEWGNNAWKRLNGMFAVAVFEPAIRRLCLARDRHGIKPLHYSDGPNSFQFASEIKALRLDPDIDSTTDHDAIDAYFSLGYIPTPRTLFRSIKKVPPGTFLTVDVQRRKVEISFYIDAQAGTQPAQVRRWNESSLDKQISDAVGRQLIADVPVGVCLSGGLDSAVLAYYAAKSGRTVDSFHVYFASPSFSEKENADHTARQLGLRPHSWEMPVPNPETLQTIFSVFDEPLADPSILPTHFLFQKTRDHVTAVLSGDGGDEIFAGYTTYLADRWARWYRQIPERIQRGLRASVEKWPVSFNRMSWDFKAKSFLAAAGRPQPWAHFGWQEHFLPTEKEDLFRPDFRSRNKFKDPAENFMAALSEFGGDSLEGWMWMDRQTHLLDKYLVKVDRLSMAHSLEVRVPFLDDHVVAEAAAIPDRYKLGLWTTKLPLRRLMKDRLPKPVLKGGKVGFAPPLAEWLEGPLSSWAESALSPKSLRQNPWINPETPLKLLNEHRAKKRDHSRRLWALLAFLGTEQKLY